MKRLLFILALILSIFPAFATHQRAGEITYRYISALTYEVTIVSYSYAPSLADRNELTLDWGDGTTSVLVRNNGPAGINPAGYYCEHLGEIVGTDIKKNLYTGQHTFPGPATYKISLEDPNRNYGIQNIPNSVDIPLYIESLLTINPFIGPNTSPLLLLPPIDKGCVGHTFLHNPGAYDPDGDSLSYKLTVCRGAGGQEIAGYKLPNLVDPNQTGTFTIDPVSGEINWNYPTLQGEYNIAFVIEEWRNGIKIGSITRDMQITIVTCNNTAPVIQAADTCVVAGDTLILPIKATDANFDRITITAAGAPFEVEYPAQLEEIKDTAGLALARVVWPTQCGHIKRSSYTVYLRAIDNSKPVSLSDIKTLNIRVIGPSCKDLSATPLGNSIKLIWRKNPCSNAVQYKIYRRNGFYGFIPGRCETGVPAYTGYRLISTLSSSDTSFSDNNNGTGLAHGIDYCYMVVAVYPDGAESIASNEACAQLKKDVAVITNVSIIKTAVTDGEIYLAWSKPTEIDTIQAPGPYKYLIYRADNLTGSGFSLIDSLSNLTDTVFIDRKINTKEHGSSYRVDVWNDTTGLRFLIGPAQPASSPFLSFSPGDNKIRISISYNVPWTNNEFTIYRLNEESVSWDSIATTDIPYFSDEGLVNGKTYCYKVRANGSYGTPGIIDPLINFSQESCAVPVDNEPPCPPELTVVPDCDNGSNILTWSYSDPTCSEDVTHFYIYYLPPQATDFVLIDSLTGSAQTSYIHRNLITIAGCYGIKAADSLWNISIMSDTVCLDSDVCGGYRLPNLFTPNNDTYNDLLVPYPYSSVEKIDLQIFNRWGKLIFETQDPDIKWDGKIMGTNQPATDGVYYYVCDVYEIRLNGVFKRTIKGQITIIR